MKIGVVGGGVVGNATARCWMEHAEVRVYDRVNERSTHPLTSGEKDQAVLDCDLIFICLPSPKHKTCNDCDLSIIEDFFKDITTRPDVFPDIVRTRNYVLRSTVPIGTTGRLAHEYGLTSLCHSPEFLTARCAVTDAQLPARNIVGEPQGWMTEAGGRLCNLYRTRFPGVQTFRMTSNESEAVKLITNGFFAVKLAFFNEVHTMMKSYNMDTADVMAAVLADGRIAHSHTKVPGPDGKFGFGGECLPKDLDNLIACINASGNDAPLCSSASDRNMGDRHR